MYTRLFQLARPGSRLSHRVVYAGFWALTLRIFLRSLSVLRIIVLARILAPEDFGLMGIALLTKALLETFTQTGFKRALIQRNGDIQGYLNTAWTMSLLRALLIGAVLFAAAPLLSLLFGDARATPLMRVLALSFIFSGLTNIAIVYFEKELEFHKRFLLRAVETISEVGVAIGLAFALESVWALVYGAIAGAAMLMVFSYVLHPYRPRLQLEWDKSKELFRYGKWVFGSSVLTYTLHHLDDFVVARVIGAAGLGLYRIAYNLSELATTEITQVAGEVLFPAYSKLQDRQEDLKKAYLKSLHLLAFLSLPMAGGFFLLAPLFTHLVLGDQWLPMVPALQVLIIWGLIRSLGVSSGALFAGVGRPDINTKLQLVKLAFLGALIYPLASTWGITGAAVAVLIADLPIDILAFILAGRRSRSSLSSIRKTIQYPIINALAMFLAIYFTQGTLSSLPDFVETVVLIVEGMAVYLGGVLLCRVAFGYTIDGVLTSRLKAWFTT